MLGGGRITNGSALTLLHQAGLPLLLPCTFLPPGRIPARLSRLPAPKKKRREPALLFVRAADREKLQDIQPQSRGCSALHRGKPRSSCSRRFWKNTPASRSEPQRGSNPDIPYKPPTSTRIAPPPQFTLYRRAGTAAMVLGLSPCLTSVHAQHRGQHGEQQRLHGADGAAGAMRRAAGGARRWRQGRAPGVGKGRRLRPAGRARPPRRLPPPPPRPRLVSFPR